MYSGSQGNNTASSSLDDSLKAIKDSELPADGCATATADEEGETNSSTSDDRVYRVNLTIIPASLFELVVFTTLGVLAYAVRNSWTWLPHTDRLFRCNDPDLLWPQNPYATVDEDSLALALMTPYHKAFLVMPLPLIFLGELGRLAFGRHARKVVRAGCVNCKLHETSRRIFRYGGLYVLGVICISVTVDLLKLTVGAHRPYFLSVCRLNRTCGTAFPEKSYYRSHFCRAAHEPDYVEELREARMSFPSNHAAVIAYAAVFAMVYVHKVIQLRSSRFLKPVLNLTIGTMALLGCASRVTLRRSHVGDVVAGAAIGAFVAAYICFCAADDFLERYSDNGSGDTGAAAGMTGAAMMPSEGGRPPSCPGGGGRSLFYRYFQIPDMAYKDRAGRDAEAPCSPKPPDAFQRDLNKRIEDIGKKLPVGGESPA
ncbi:phospholipid phosphatase-related protein type 1-like [Haemaphysalis longicornis]